MMQWQRYIFTRANWIWKSCIIKSEFVLFSWQCNKFNCFAHWMTLFRLKRRIGRLQCLTWWFIPCDYRICHLNLGALLNSPKTLTKRCLSEKVLLAKQSQSFCSHNHNYFGRFFVTSVSMAAPDARYATATATTTTTTITAITAITATTIAIATAISLDDKRRAFNARAFLGSTQALCYFFPQDAKCCFKSQFVASFQLHFSKAKLQLDFWCNRSIDQSINPWKWTTTSNFLSSQDGKSRCIAIALAREFVPSFLAALESLLLMQLELPMQLQLQLQQVKQLMTMTMLMLNMMMDHEIIWGWSILAVCGLIIVVASSNLVSMLSGNLNFAFSNYNRPTNRPTN